MYLKKFLKILVFLLGSSFVYYFFETSFFLEAAFAEEIDSSPESKKEAVSSLDEVKEKPATKSYSTVLWEYRFPVLVGLLLLTSSVVFLLYIYSGEVPPAPDPAIYSAEVPVPDPATSSLMPHVPEQTLPALLEIRPDVHRNLLTSAAMPQILSVDTYHYYTDPSTVVNPFFIKGFNSGSVAYQVYLMPLSSDFESNQLYWLNETQRLFGAAKFPSPYYTYMYSQVAVIPVDSINYTVYHKVDIVHVTPDSNMRFWIVPEVTRLFKDLSLV